MTMYSMRRSHRHSTVDLQVQIIQLALLVLLMTTNGHHHNHDGDPQVVPCYFIFGDSLSDSGNNNGLSTDSKANYRPYAVDFPRRQITGRFTNGRNPVDVIAEHLGFRDYIPPFSTAPRGSNRILQGVNYASGAGGIRPETGRHWGERINIDQQLRNHQSTISSIASILLQQSTNTINNGSSSPYNYSSSTNHDDVDDHLGKCLYAINIGSNDYINNYFYPENYTTSQKYTPEEYAEALITSYHKQIKFLYNLGARKIALFGLGPLGCTPFEIDRFGEYGTCANEVNVASEMFNLKLMSLVDDLNGSSDLEGAHFTYISSILVQITSTAAGLLNSSFTVVNAPCCSSRLDGLCVEGGATCEERSKYLFWDKYHPTEALNVISGDRAYKASTPLDAHPVDISTLVRL